MEELVPCMTFEDLLTQAGTDHVDLIQIDAEGYDLEILAAIDLGSLRPPIVRFEHKNLGHAERVEAVRSLAELGYGLLQDHGDTTAYLHHERTRRPDRPSAEPAG